MSRTAFEDLLSRVTAPLVGADGAERTASALTMADISLRPQEWYALRVALPVLAGFLMYVYNGVLVESLLVALIAGVAPSVVLSQRRAARRAAIVRQLPEAMVLLTNSLEGGSALLQAVEAVAETSPDPIGTEFRRVMVEVRYGIPLDEALAHMSVRVASKDFAMLVSAVEIHRQMGGSLAVILRSISETMRERIKLTERVQILTAQTRVSGYIITALPFGVALILLLVAPSYMAPLFTHVLGYLALLVAAILIGTAYFVMGRITEIEV
jgi:tight adherence protein B